MDYGEFTVLGDSYTYATRHCIVWGEGSGRYFRPIDGDWGILWETRRDYREGDLQVTPRFSPDIIGPSTSHRDHEHSGIFAVCRPDVPCITPGTYAFLGAAAALR